MSESVGDSRGVLLSGDLFFGTRVTGTATALGGRVEIADSMAAFGESVAGSMPSLVLIDLNTPGLDVAAVVAGLPTDSRPHVIAFGSHVDVPRLQAARDAGCDEVVPRSRFTTQLADTLRTHLGLG